MTNKTELLRAAIQDESLPLPARRTAAEHYVVELVNATTVPADHDSEVLERMKPWADGPVKDLIFNSGFAKAAQGEALAIAKKEVQKRNQLRAVLAVVVDEMGHQFARLAACSWILENYAHVQKWARDQHTPERLLAEVLPPSATKIVSAFSHNLPVERPPRDLKDVWTL